MKELCFLATITLIVGTVKGDYRAVNVTRSDTAITATLLSADKEMISPLTLTIQLESAERVRLKIQDPNNRRYEVPYPEVPYPEVPHPEVPYPEVPHPEVPYPDPVRGDRTDALPRYKVLVTEKPFSVRIVRREDNNVIFDTSSHQLVFQNQLLSIGTTLSSSLLYGIGQDSAPLLRDMNNKKHTLWAQGAYYEQGQGVNLYGAHPFYINLESAGSPKSNGVLLMNSNAMDITLSNTPRPAVTWHIIGGILDFTVLVGDSPLDVAGLYAQRVGNPFLPPIWALGFHLCRWGYNNTQYMESVISDMMIQEVPVDVQWSDIDYMSEHEDFTISEERFAGLPEYVSRVLHARGKRYVAMMDPAIHARFGEGYSPVDSGIKGDVFIKNSTGHLLIGNVWPGDTVFPDFLHPDTVTWWTHQLANFSNSLPYDGLWIDMNEPASFYDGSREGCPWSDPLEKPPYYPGVRKTLQWQTLCMTAKQHQYLHYDVHNLYGWSEARATRAALLSQRPKNRTFILSRSTFVGSGRWAAHWTGDIRSSWEDMRATIPGLINMNLFGIPLVGADICGFEGDSNKELCIRWSQLGAFYPFSRNHNTLFARPQEPTAWGTETTAIIRAALLQRYRLMLYLYNLFVGAHQYGTPVMQALFLQFPEDTTTYDKDRQFMLGSGVMVCPVLDEGADTVWIYFPPARWYTVWELETVSEGSEVRPYYPAPLPTINVFARGGTILPVVKERAGVTPTAELVLASRDISLYCYLDEDGGAEGTLFVDDGFSENEDRPVHRVKFRVSEQKLYITPVGEGDREGERGLVRTVSSVRVGGVVLSGDKSEVEVLVGHTVQRNVSYNPVTGVLEVTELRGDGDTPVTTDTSVIVTWRVGQQVY